MNKSILNKLSAVCALLLVFNPLSSQDFSWIKGTNLLNQSGQYGTTGVSAPSNNPGAREGAATWKDNAGNFWMFGGNGRDHLGNYGGLSDLWKYTVATNEWVFIKGNDVFAQITLYGTMGVPSSTSKPGGRHSSAAWTDASGDLWLMGGYGLSGGSGLGYLNDLWKYNISTNEWTYVNGSSICYQPGEYGTVGIPSTTNTPGARMSSVTWADASGDLWLFGGYGNSTSSVTIGSLNDVWRYNVANNTWTWTKGSMLKDQTGIYGAMGTSSAANDPGGRSAPIGWSDGSGSFWLFGGEGYDQNSTSTGLLNDLWKYNMSAGEWTWVKGNTTFNQVGAYGLQGVPSSTDTPGGRTGSLSWRDAVGNLWLFGGKGFPGSSVAAISGALNDLWKYNVANNEWTWVKGTALTNQLGIYGTQSASTSTNIPGARTTHAGWIDASDDLYIFGGYGQAGAGAAGSLNDLWKYTNCFITPITMTIIAQDSLICAGESTSLTVSGSSNYLWTTNLATTGYLVISPSVTTTYSVVTSGNKGCRYTASFTENVSSCDGIDKLTNGDLKNNIYPNPNNGDFKISAYGNEEKKRLLIFNSMGEFIFEKLLTESETSVRTSLSSGMYYYKIEGAGKTLSSGKLVIQ